jgi:hypothetical protein
MTLFVCIILKLSREKISFVITGDVLINVGYNNWLSVEGWLGVEEAKILSVC